MERRQPGLPPSGRPGIAPVLGATGDPGPPAAALLVALGIEPAAEGNRQVMRDVREHLATIRTAVLGDSLIRAFPTALHVSC